MQIVLALFKQRLRCVHLTFPHSPKHNCSELAFQCVENLLHFLKAWLTDSTEYCNQYLTHSVRVFVLGGSHESFPFIWAFHKVCISRWEHHFRSRFLQAETKAKEWWSVSHLISIEHADKPFISLPSRCLFVIDRCLQSIHSIKGWMSADI